MGERLDETIPDSAIQEFQSSLPVGERLTDGIRTVGITIFQSSLPVGGATTYTGGREMKRTISIPAPRGGSDSKDVQINVFIFGKNK